MISNDDPMILVQDGNVFEGKLHHWEDCFFSFPDGFTFEQKMFQIKKRKKLKLKIKLLWKELNLSAQQKQILRRIAT